MVYLDAASAEPMHPAALQALQAALADGWADPTRLYREGRRARLLLDAARESVADVLGAAPPEVSFTASGTQAVQAAMSAVLAGRRRAGGHLVVSAVEHTSVLQVAEAHAAAGGGLTRVPVDRGARVDRHAFAEAVRTPGTALACLQSANHEIGTLQPVAEAAEACRAAGVPLLVDAAQSAGRVPVPPGWSVLTASARKWGGPAGVGVLAVRRGTRYRTALPGGATEYGRVPGTPDVPAVVAAAAALRAAHDAAADGGLPARLHRLTELIRRQVPGLVSDCEVLGPDEGRLPHIVTFSCLYVDGEALLSEFDRRGFAVSSGSACVADTVRPSHVLEAMGVLTQGNVRVSLPATTADADVAAFLEALPEVVAAVRGGVLAADAAVPVPAAEPPEAAAGGAAAAVPELVVDALGRRCPFPVILLARRIADVKVGGVVAVLADDEAARLDVPAWCEMRGHEYVGETRLGDAPAYLVRRS